MAELDRDALAARLRDGLETIGSSFPANAPERLAALAELVAAWGQRINLSGHRSPEQIADRLILDAAALAAVLPAFESLADLGSGAGFPGLPIAILYPEAELVLVEAHRRRHHFQRAAVRELQITNTRPLHGRIERLEPTPCSVALAQAVAPAVEAAELIRPWARPGGWLAIPAASDAPLPGFAAVHGQVREVAYLVPGGLRRKLWLLERGS